MLSAISHNQTRPMLTIQNDSHYNDVIINAMASQITGVTIVYSTLHSGIDQRKHQSSASLAFVWGIHRWPVNSPHKAPMTHRMFPFDDVIMRQARTNFDQVPGPEFQQWLPGRHALLKFEQGNLSRCPFWTSIGHISYHLCLIITHLGWVNM